jgi:hypothetical protein
MIRDPGPEVSQGGINDRLGFLPHQRLVRNVVKIEDAKILDLRGASINVIRLLLQIVRDFHVQA